MRCTGFSRPANAETLHTGTPTQPRPFAYTLPIRNRIPYVRTPVKPLTRYFDSARQTAKEKPWVFGLYIVLRLIVLAIMIRSFFTGAYEYVLLCLLVIVLARQTAKEKPWVFGLYIVLRLIVLAIMIRSFFTGAYEYVLLCLLVIVLLYIPDFLERKLKVEIPSVLEAIVILFIFAAEILGEIEAFYIKIPFWDTMLHTLWGFLAAGIGFALADILNRSQASRLQLTPIYMAIVAFCFSMSAGALWELFEYGVDSILGFDMQKDTIVAAFSSVTLDPTNSNIAIPVTGITETAITTADGTVIIPGGYLEKDTIVAAFSSVTLDPTNSNIAIPVTGITETAITTADGTVIIPGGYLDIGLHDSMEDLLVNMAGAIVFSIIGFVYVKNRNNGKGKSFAAHFIPRALRPDEKD